MAKRARADPISGLLEASGIAASWRDELHGRIRNFLEHEGIDLAAAASSSRDKLLEHVNATSAQRSALLQALNVYADQWGRAQRTKIRRLVRAEDEEAAADEEADEEEAVEEEEGEEADGGEEKADEEDEEGEDAGGGEQEDADDDEGVEAGPEAEADAVEEEEVQEEEEIVLRVLRQPAAEEALIRSPAPDGDGAFTIRSLMRACESTGYPAAPQPATMRLPLYAAQRQALGWALDQEALDLHAALWQRQADGLWHCALTGERARAAPRATSGGLFALDMGCGKTVVLGALVLAHPYDAADVAARGFDAAAAAAPRTRATLVVAKKTLIEQWRRELVDRDDGRAFADAHRLRVAVHDKDARDVSDLFASDVVLTTFERFKADRRLHRVVWWRVVVDESAQHLRTTVSATSRQLRALTAVHRWVLSGTPFDTRGLQALGGQLAVLGLAGAIATSEWWASATWRQAQAVLGHVMLRHSLAQRFAQSGASVLPVRAADGTPLRKEHAFVRLDFERDHATGRSHAEVVVRALEHLARLELRVGLGEAHELFAEWPAGRLQELVLASSHPNYVEPGEVAARLPMLQTSRADKLSPGSLIPTRLVTIDCVLGGLIEDGFGSPAEKAAVINGSTACCKCAMPFAPPGASAPTARVLVSGCCHSYCKRCLSEKMCAGIAALQQVHCDHAGCGNRLQLGLLRELVSEAAFEASEWALDPSPEWRQLDTSLPGAEALAELRVSVCDAFCSEAHVEEHARYATRRRCNDGQVEVRQLTKALQPPLAAADVLRPGTLADATACVLCLYDKEPEELAALPCGHSQFCRPCLAQLHARNPLNVRCPMCRAEHVAPPMRHFCGKACAKAACQLRLQHVDADVPRTRACDGCTAPLDQRRLWRCHWPKRRCAAGTVHFGAQRFHSKTCAEAWFASQLVDLADDFEGNRRLYEEGANTRPDIAELTPLMRRAGETRFHLGYEHANAAGAVTRGKEWDEHYINFPGMPPFSFAAHLDAAAGHWSTQAQIPRGPKIAKLLELIEGPADVDNSDDKFLVFSASAHLLDLVAGALAATYPPGFFVRAREGESALSRFRDEPECCGLLLESGTFAAGLTLTNASTCYVLEPQLDPAAQTQLESRIYRPGQTRDVRIVHLYMSGTIEERIVQRHPDFVFE